MAKYDLTVLVGPEVKEKALDAYVAKFEKLIKALEGKVVKFTEMGHKQLAYKIKNMQEANYLSWIVELPESGVVQLDKKLTIDKEVLRHLLVKAE